MNIMKSTLLTFIIVLALLPGAARAQLFLGGAENNVISEYGLDGTPINPSLDASDIADGEAVMGLAVSDNDLFVAQIGGDGVECTFSGALVEDFPFLIDTAGVAVSGYDLFVDDGFGDIDEYTIPDGMWVQTVATGLEPNQQQSLAVCGDYLFVMNGYSVSEYQISSATPINPSAVTLNNVGALAVSGSTLFVSCTGVSDNQGFVGAYTVDSATGSLTTINATLIPGLEYPYGIAASGNDLYVAYRDTSELVHNFVSHYTVSDKMATPANDSPLITVAGYGTNMTLAIAPAANTACGQLFVTTGTNNFVGESALSSPELNPAFLSQFNRITGLGVSGNNLFVADAGDDVILENAGPGSVSEYTLAGALVTPSLISDLDSPPGALTVSGNKIFVETEDGTIGEYMLDGTPVNDSLVSGLQGGLYPPLAVSGNYMFVAGGFADNNVLCEYNIVTGEEINHAVVPVNYYLSLTTCGNILFVANSETGVISKYTIDPGTGAVSPANLSFIQGLPEPGGMAVSGNYLFVACFGSDQANPGFISEYNISGTTGNQINPLFITGLNDWGPWSMAIAPGECAPATSSCCVPPPSGLIDWWPGDGNALDIVTGIYAQTEGTVTYAPGMVSEAFSFDGTGGYVYGSAAPEAGLPAGTVDFWFNVNTWNPAITNLLWYSSANLPGQGVHPGAMFIGSSGPGTPDNGELLFAINGNYDNWAHSGLVPQPNTWYHVAATWDGATGMNLYVNGNLLGNCPYLAGAPSGLVYNIIGRGVPVNSQINGLIDEVEIFNRALTQPEINSIYTAGSAGKCKFCYVGGNPSLTFTQAGSSTVLTWPCGAILQSESNANGTWVDVPNATSPYVIPSSTLTALYRVRYSCNQ